MKAIFKTNRIVVIATCLLMLFSTLSINVKAEEYDNYEFVAFITQCIENEKTISVLEKMERTLLYKLNQKFYVYMN